MKKEVPLRNPASVMIVGEARRNPSSFWGQMWQGLGAFVVRITLSGVSVALAVGSPPEQSRGIKWVLPLAMQTQSLILCFFHKAGCKEFESSVLAFP